MTETFTERGTALGADADAAIATGASTWEQSRVTMQAEIDRLQAIIDGELPPPPPTGGQALLGMSAPTTTWDTRVSEVGPGLQARRIFLTSLTDNPVRIAEAVAAGQAPMISAKVPGWAGVGAGTYDNDLEALAARLDGLGVPVFIALHHEPGNSAHPPQGEAGTPAQWAQMQRHALPILSRGQVRTTVILNGWMFNSDGLGYSDAELAQWLPADVRALIDVVAADTYSMAVGDEEPAGKMQNMIDWAERMGDVRGLGVGEFNSWTAQGITDACALLKSSPLFRVGCLWNNDDPPRVTHVTGARLTAFKSALSSW